MITFVPMPTDDAEALWAGGTDANGQLPERAISSGVGTPCRHCLEIIGEGEPMLVLAHRPFPSLQPYAECGPIFLHAERCTRHAGGPALPPVLGGQHYLMKAYGEDDRILYGTGAVVETQAITERAEALFERDDVAYLHVRSASNNCWLCRIDSA